MRIVIAAWHLRDFNVGIGRYCRNLIEAIARVDRNNDYEILMAHGDPPSISQPNFTLTRIQFPLFRRQFWEQVSHLLVKPYDVLHFPYDSFLIRKRGKFVATIHDMLPALSGQDGFSLRPSKAIASYYFKHRSKAMDQIITDSECSKRDIIRFMNVAPEKIAVVYLGVEERFFRTREDRAMIHRLGIYREYLLYVGGHLKVKNPEVVIEAYSKLPPVVQKRYGLVLVGDLEERKDLREMVAQKECREGIVFAGVVSEEVLLQLYKNASVFIFPYLYAGFGLPLLEAMASGIPTIASNRSSIPEIAGDAACLCDPENAGTLAAEIERLLLDRDLRNECIRKGLDRAAQFTWEKTAKATVQVYQQAALG